MKKKQLTMMLLSCQDALEASHEASVLGGESLHRNACVLARAVRCGGKRLFSSGQQVLDKLPPQTVACWISAYDRLCRAQCQDWQTWKQLLADDAGGRLRWKVLRTLGILPRAVEDMTDRDFLYCVLQMVLDSEEQLQRLCPDCRSRMLEERCPVCGGVQFGTNPNFDEKRYEELKRYGSPAMAAVKTADNAGTDCAGGQSSGGA